MKIHVLIELDISTLSPLIPFQVVTRCLSIREKKIAHALSGILQVHDKIALPTCIWKVP